MSNFVFIFDFELESLQIGCEGFSCCFLVNGDLLFVLLLMQGKLPDDPLHKVEAKAICDLKIELLLLLFFAFGLNPMCRLTILLKFSSIRLRANLF